MASKSRCGRSVGGLTSTSWVIAVRSDDGWRRRWVNTYSTPTMSERQDGGMEQTREGGMDGGVQGEREMSGTREGAERYGGRSFRRNEKRERGMHREKEWVIWSIRDGRWRNNTLC